MGCIRKGVLLCSLFLGLMAGPGFAQVADETAAADAADLVFPQEPQVPLPGSAIPQFVDPLPLLDVAGGPIKTVIAGTSEIELRMREFRANVMPSTFVPATGTYRGTWVWGYIVGCNAPVSPLPTFTGPVVVATRNKPAQFRFVNNLGSTFTTNVLAWKNSTDQTLHWADPLNDSMNMCAHMIQPGMLPLPPCDQHYAGPIPAIVHLHGGYVPPVIDGGPDQWYTSDGKHHGSGYYTKPEARTASNEAVFRYPMDQEAAPIWFHDHTLGATRLNVYAGLAGACVLTDPNLKLPTGLNAIGLQDGTVLNPVVPLVIQDRMFDTNGQLFFPLGGDNPEHPFWAPEFTGDTILVNGKVWPFLNVQPKRYRFIIIDGSNARTYEMFLADPADSTQVGPPIWQIGTDGGYLDKPVKIDPAAGEHLLMMPGERADIIVDFAEFGGKDLLLTNVGITPFPSGDPVDPTTNGRILLFHVQGGTVTDKTYNPASGIALRPPMVRLVNPTAGTLAPGVKISKIRQLTLNEVEGAPTTVGGVSFPGGPLEILVNNTKWEGKVGSNGPPRCDFVPITVGGQTAYYSEIPNEGETELWEIVNLTADAHPIHTHLVQFQLLNRELYDPMYVNTYAAAFPGGNFVPGFGPPLNYNDGNPRALGGNPDIVPFLEGSAAPPFANEAGWKDTIMMPPGMVTRIVMRFAPQYRPVNAKDKDLAFIFDPFALQHGYVWHCHIIDHEDNEMMRPYAVNPKPGVARTYVQGKDY